MGLAVSKRKQHGSGERQAVSPNDDADRAREEAEQSDDSDEAGDLAGAHVDLARDLGALRSAFENAAENDPLKSSPDC